VYVYRGGLEVVQGNSASAVPIKRMAILKNEGDGLVLRAQANTRAILIAGKPLNEPIAQYGPFVMNTREELVQAVDDFRAGLMG
jgi:redox-sensitive bicupin YhaK (pirin superfamily)